MIPIVPVMTLAELLAEILSAQEERQLSNSLRRSFDLSSNSDPFEVRWFTITLRFAQAKQIAAKIAFDRSKDA